MSRKTLLSLLVVVLVASFVSACSSSKKAPLPITVQLAPAPPGALEVSHSVQIGAQTTNDTAGAGVDWTLACTSADCGSISPAHTASGGATTYTAPSVVPTGGSVTITATSTTDTTQSASADVTINPLGNNTGLAQNNQYAFYVTGADANGNFYAAAGSFTSNGDGTLIDGGEEDFVDTSFVIEGDTLTGGTYNIGADGRGTVSFTANFNGAPDTAINGTGVQTFTVVTTSDFVNTGTHLLIVEADGFATSSGTVDLQSSGDFAGSLVGPYVFTLAGQDFFNGNASTTVGGVAIPDGAGNLTGVIDSNDAATGSSNGVDLTGATYTAPDANGRGTIALNNAAQQNFTYYMVNANVLRIVETDDVNFDFFGGGSAYVASGAASFDATSVTGSFVFTDNGQESAVGAVAIGGQFTTDGAGNITAGVDDASEGGVLTTAAAVTGTYAVPDATMPRVVFTFTSGNSGAVSNVIAYLAGGVNFLDVNSAAQATGALLMDSDGSANGTGFLIEQAPTSASTFAGNYGFDEQFDFQTSFEIDISGQGFSDGSANFNGTGDVATLGSATAGEAMVGTFAADALNPGRLTLTETFTPSGFTDLVLYQISSDQVIGVGTDSGAVQLAVYLSQ